MSEGIGGAAKAEGEGPQAGGMPTAEVPVQKKFFLVEYLEEVRKGLTWMRSAPKPEQPITRKVTKGLIKWSKLRKARVGIVVVFLVMGAASGLFAAQAGSTPVKLPGGGVGPGETGHNWTATAQGSVTENGKTSTNFTMNSTKLTALMVRLSWTDEPAGGVLLTNQPDQLGLNITAPDGKNWAVATSTVSPLTWTLDETDATYGPGMDWMVTVVGGTMGDITRAGGGIGPCVRCSMDTSNSYTLTVESAW